MVSTAEYGGRHLRVDRSSSTVDHLFSVFVGNLPFSADEELIRNTLRSVITVVCVGVTLIGCGHRECGDISNVRVVRDKETGLGKGFAYVQFSDKSSVLFAVQQSGKLALEGRSLRITHCKRGGRQQPFAGQKAIPKKKKRLKRRN